MSILIILAVILLCVAVLYFVGIPLFVIIGRFLQHRRWKRDLKRVAKMYGSPGPDKRPSR